MTQFSDYAASVKTESAFDVLAIAKRLIADGGAKLNDQAVTDPGMLIKPEQIAEPLKLSAGKKRHALAKLAS